MSFSSSTAHDRNVVMKDYSSVVPKGLFSTDMRGKPMTTNTFYKQINTMQLFINKKKNKNKFKIKDGIITLEIKLDTNNIICNWCYNPKLCSLRKCRHVYFLLLNHF